MAKVRLLQGKPLMVGGKVALSDDCCCGGVVCPDTVIVRFHGVTICATCYTTGISSAHLADVGLFNDVDVTCIDFGSTCGDMDCLRDNGFGVIGSPPEPPQINYKDFGTADCSGIPAHDVAGDVAVAIGRQGATWYVMAATNDGIAGIAQTVIFQGSGTDRSNIPNTVTCSGTLTADILTACNIDISLFYPGGEGGTAAISFP